MTLVMVSIAGCGQVRDVIHDPPYDGDNLLDGGSSGGRGVTSSEDGGNGPNGSGGFRGDGSVTGTGGASSGAGGGSPSSGGTTGTGAGGAVGVPDPHREERTKLVADYCALLDKYPCREFSSNQGLIRASTPPEEKRRICEQESQVYAYQHTVNGCYDEWVAAMKCNATLAFTCPCADTQCQLPNDATGYDPTTGDIPEGACFEERTAYGKCQERLHAADGWQTPIVGSRAKVEWRMENSGAGCHAEGVPEGSEDFFVARCEGAPGGPFRCDCTVNSRLLSDWSNPQFASFSASDCRGVAQSLADGACVKVLDCCFAWKNGSREGVPPIDDCQCTADPTTNIFGPTGFASCQAMADAYSGSVVSICPQYR
jgi:hypothetical protein